MVKVSWLWLQQLVLSKWSSVAVWMRQVVLDGGLEQLGVWNEVLGSDRGMAIGAGHLGMFKTLFN
jgi:hypothetical protein